MPGRTRGVLEQPYGRSKRALASNGEHALAPPCGIRASPLDFCFLRRAAILECEPRPEFLPGRIMVGRPTADLLSTAPPRALNRPIEIRLIFRRARERVE